MIVDLLVQYQVAITAFIGAAIGTGVLWRKFLSPMAKLIQAQLTTNGGSSLVDKVNKLTIATPANHTKAEEHWEKLETKQEEIALNILNSDTKTDRTLLDFESRLKRLEAIIIEGAILRSNS